MEKAGAWQGLHESTPESDVEVEPKNYCIGCLCLEPLSLAGGKLGSTANSSPAHLSGLNAEPKNFVDVTESWHTGTVACFRILGSLSSAEAFSRENESRNLAAAASRVSRASTPHWTLEDKGVSNNHIVIVSLSSYY